MTRNFLHSFPLSLTLVVSSYWACLTRVHERICNFVYRPLRTPLSINPSFGGSQKGGYPTGPKGRFWQMLPCTEFPPKSLSLQYYPGRRKLRFLILLDPTNRNKTTLLFSLDPRAPSNRNCNLNKFWFDKGKRPAYVCKGKPPDDKLSFSSFYVCGSAMILQNEDLLAEMLLQNISIEVFLPFQPLHIYQGAKKWGFLKGCFCKYARLSWLWSSECRRHWGVQCPWVFFAFLGVTLDSPETLFAKTPLLLVPELKIKALAYFSVTKTVASVWVC